MHAKLTLAIHHLQAQGTVEEVQAVQGKLRPIPYLDAAVY